MNKDARESPEAVVTEFDYTEMDEWHQLALEEIGQDIILLFEQDPKELRRSRRFIDVYLWHDAGDECDY